MRTISVKFLPTTETKPTRIQASAGHGAKVVLSYDSEQTVLEAVGKLAKLLGWHTFGDWVGGETKEGWVFVCKAANAKSMPMPAELGEATYLVVL